LLLTDVTWLLNWMPPGCRRGWHLDADVACHLAGDVACHIAANSDGFDDKDNDAVCHMAADMAADLDDNNDVDNDVA
jgi:hypothetical protein